MAPFKRVRKGPKEPAYSAFSQQDLTAYKPVFTPKKAIAIFLTIGFVFVPIGLILLATSRSVVEVSARYDDICMRGTGTNAEREARLMKAYGDQSRTEQLLSCDAPPTFVIPLHMRAPIFIYYELSNFHQNHRRYVKSRSDAQLRGDFASASSLAGCHPELYSDPENETGLISPCGLVAWSLFNDTYSVDMRTSSTAQVVTLPIRESGIAWKSDVDKKFSENNVTHFNDDHDTRGGGTITGLLKENEHFIVWMRNAVLPKFRKLWGRIERDIPAGTILRVNIQNQYNTYRFEGTKRVVLSTTSWMGGRNDFLGLAYIIVGIASIIFGFIFAAIGWRWPRKLGDVSLLSWRALTKNEPIHEPASH